MVRVVRSFHVLEDLPPCAGEVLERDPVQELDFEGPERLSIIAFVLVDAMVIEVRRQGAVRATSALTAVGVNEKGYREILGLQIANSETREGWLETFRWLKGRGLDGVEPVASDAHEGLVEALHRCFQGATWQRCQTHFRRNILDKTRAE